MLEIKTLPVTELQQNCRILWKQGTTQALVVDPGGDAPLISSFLKSQGLVCEQIWLTHSHFDHCGGVARLMSEGVKILYGHIIEREFRQRVEDILTLYGISSKDMKNSPEPTHYIKGGETLEFQSVEFKVLFTPGHSPGHLCFYAPSENVLLAGDTLFNGSIGRTDLPGGDYKTLINSIVEKILILPDDTKVLSGHGPDTTIGHERKNNPFLTGEINE
jgi:hydroxyacylglutathione hydrolase